MILFSEVRQSLRRLVRTPTFTAVAVSTLALGIGGSTALFSVVNAALLRPLPYTHPEMVVQVLETEPQRPGRWRELSYPDFVDLRDRGRAFAGLAGFSARGLTLNEDGLAERIPGVLVTGSFFRTLGVAPALGRDFADGDDRGGAEPVVILGHGLWQRRFGTDPAVIGRRVDRRHRPHGDGGASARLPVRPRGLSGPVAAARARA